MKLKALLKDLDYLSIKNNVEEIDIKGIACDSRLIQEDYLFVAIKGTKYDGHNFIQEAIEKGAKAIVVSKSYPIADLASENRVKQPIPYIRLADTRKALAKLFSCFHHHPARHIKIIGITGTNGKTTVSYLLNQILTSEGHNTGLIGTINYKILDQLIPATTTTPPPENLYPLLKEMVNKHLNYAILEVSSHSLDQQRTEGINFLIGIFTNLGSDHLDYHKTRNNYFQSKAKMFRNLGPKSFAVINSDDAYASKLRRLTQARVINYGLRKDAEVKARDISSGGGGLKFSCILPGKILNRERFRIDIESPLFGRHNVYNILAAVSAALCLDVSLESIKEGIKGLVSLPGRLELVDCGQPFKTFIDYAHTDCALRASLRALREFAPRKIYLVFGCGGERDRNKRAKMGKVATTLSDFTILTNDNPRSEDPERIIRDIRRGIKGKNYTVILDRYEAIKKALFLAKKDDIVLIAGKGHEDYQFLKEGPVAFNDQKVVRCLLSKRF